MKRQYKTYDRTQKNDTKTTLTKFEYLTGIIKDSVNLYARSFERTERPKIAEILKYYGLEIDEDMSYDLRWDEFWEGNKILTMTWWCYGKFGSIETSICY